MMLLLVGRGTGRGTGDGQGRCCGGSGPILREDGRCRESAAAPWPRPPSGRRMGSLRNSIN